MMFQDHRFIFDKIEVQPGQPSFEEWKFDNKTISQPFKVQISLDTEGIISDISIEVSNYVIIKISEKLHYGEILTIDESGRLTIVNEKGKLVKERSIENNPVLGEGTHTIQFDCQVDKGSPKVKVKVRLDGKEEIIRSKM